MYKFVTAIALLIAASLAYSHHSIPGEFGDSSRPTEMVEAEVVNVRWMNPHIFIDMQITGGEVGAPGEKWRLVTHPINIITDYGFAESDFKPGDKLEIVAWTHLRGQPLLHPRAIKVNDGPFRSLLIFADMRDIVSGRQKELGIVPGPHLNGSSPLRAGKEVAEGLKELGYLDDNGRVALPADY